MLGRRWSGLAACPWGCTPPLSTWPLEGSCGSLPACTHRTGGRRAGQMSAGNSARKGPGGGCSAASRTAREARSRTHCSVSRITSSMNFCAPRATNRVLRERRRRFVSAPMLSAVCTAGCMHRLTWLHPGARSPRAARNAAPAHQAPAIQRHTALVRVEQAVPGQLARRRPAALTNKGCSLRPATTSSNDDDGPAMAALCSLARLGSREAACRGG